MNDTDNAIILRALSLLLSYPDETMRGHLPAVRAALNAELAKGWKPIVERKDPLPDAEEWAKVKDKLDKLER